MKDNAEILHDREAAYNAINGPRVGDYLKLPTGDFTRFTHEWADHIQTGGYSGYYLGNGYLSYSGGLDSGLKTTDIIPTEETRPGEVWFFDKDISGAGRGVYFKMTFRVFSIREGADTSGIPQIAAHAKKLIRDQAETITRINGNGQPYTLPIPEVHIQCNDINDIALKHIEENTGLKLQRSGWSYWAQPMKASQITALILTYNFETTYYNNATHGNTLMMKFKQ